MDKVGEKEIIGEACQVFELIDWPCEVHTRLHAFLAEGLFRSLIGSRDTARRCLGFEKIN